MARPTTASTPHHADERLLSPFLDAHGRFRRWPVRPAKRDLALHRLARLFAAGTDYRERDVNVILGAAHTFGDATMLRRALCDAGLLARTDDGTRYWKPAEAAEVES